MSRILLVFIAISSSSVWANTITIATGVPFDSQFDTACAARIHEIQEDAASAGIQVEPNVSVAMAGGHTDPHCSPNCGAVIENKTCDAVLSIAHGTLSVSTVKIRSQSCANVAFPAKKPQTVFQNAYLSDSFRGPLCVIDTVELSGEWLP